MILRLMRKEQEIFYLMKIILLIYLDQEHLSSDLIPPQMDPETLILSCDHQVNLEGQSQVLQDLAQIGLLQVVQGLID